jgi:hypothetical protein
VLGFFPPRWGALSYKYTLQEEGKGVLAGRRGWEGRGEVGLSLRAVYLGSKYPQLPLFGWGEARAPSRPLRDTLTH